MYRLTAASHMASVKGRDLVQCDHEDTFASRILNKCHLRVGEQWLYQELLPHLSWSYRGSLLHTCVSAVWSFWSVPNSTRVGSGSVHWSRLWRPHRSACQPHAPSSPHSWTRPWHTWTSPEPEDQPLIPAASLSPGTCCRFWIDEANKTSSLKRQDEIQWLQGLIQGLIHSLSTHSKLTFNIWNLLIQN